LDADSRPTAPIVASWPWRFARWARTRWPDRIDPHRFAGGRSDV